MGTLTLSNVALYNRALHRIGETELVEAVDENRPAAEACELAFEDVLRRSLEAYPWPWALAQKPLAKINTETQNTAGDAANLVFQVDAWFLDSSQLAVTLTETGVADAAQTAGTDYTTTFPVTGTRGYVTFTSAPSATQTVKTVVTHAREGWDYIYALPADCVRPVDLVYEDTKRELVDRYTRGEFEMFPNDAGDGWYLGADLNDNEFDALAYIRAISNLKGMPRFFVDAVMWGMAAELAFSIKKDPAMGLRYGDIYEKALDKAFAKALNVNRTRTEPTTPSLNFHGSDIDEQNTLNVNSAGTGAT